MYHLIKLVQHVFHASECITSHNVEKTTPFLSSFAWEK